MDLVAAEYQDNLFLVERTEQFFDDIIEIFVIEVALENLVIENFLAACEDDHRNIVALIY